MTPQDIALIAAGVIGSAIALVHGVLTERFMVKPVAAAFGDNPRISPAIRRLIPILLHLSTAAWFAGGLALIAAALWFDASARLATALCVGALYLYGAVGNLAGVRGFHPGWVLYAIAVALIAYAVA
jgi:hypothetical protein